MPKFSNNAAQARSVLRDAIQSGVYPHGSMLPSTRQLATQFGINRNTATKIYHELADDNLVELTANRPPIVLGACIQSKPDSLRERMREVLAPMLLESRLIGLSAEDSRRLIVELTDEFYASYPPHTIYVAECNEFEARIYAQELTLKLGSIVLPVLLDRLNNGVAADIIVTPYFHLHQAKEALGSKSDQLVGMVVTADSSDIARVASMVTNGPLGIIAFGLHAAERLRRLLSFQIEVPMITAGIDHPETLDELASKVECVVCTQRSYSMARNSIPDVPLTLIQYHPDEQSIDLLRREIQRIRDVSTLASAPDTI
jgi:DNA-binding transcriptional regulator YhcF (GntR family)